MEEKIEKTLDEFMEYLLDNTKDIPSEYAKIVDENFFDLIGDE